MKNVVCISLLLLLLTGCKENRNGNASETVQTTDKKDSSSAQGSDQKTSLTIIPGERLGTLELGKEVAVVLKDSLGEPLHQDSAMGKSSQTFALKSRDINGRNAILSIFTSTHNNGNIDGKRGLLAARTNATVFVTKNGLKVGSQYRQIQRNFKLVKLGTFTDDGATYSLYDTNAGIAFEVNNDSICTGIGIHKAEELATDSYLPIYDTFKRSGDFN